jgi:hypothetical protein
VRGLVDRYENHLNRVVAHSWLRRVRNVSCEVEIRLLIAASWHRPESTEVCPLTTYQPRLFKQFAFGGLQGSLALLDRARWKFGGHAFQRIAVLPDQSDMAVGRHRADGTKATRPQDVINDLSSVRKLDEILVEVDGAAG